MSLKEIQEWLGHSAISTTADIYSHLNYSSKLNVASTLTNVFGGEIWIVETKGGFDRTGASEDIDAFSPKKFEVLRAYLEKHALKGGFVRFDKQSEELCICTKEYSDDIHSSNWEILSEVFQ